MKILFIFLTILACGPEAKPLKPLPDNRLVRLQEQLDKDVARAKHLRDRSNGWLTATDCDGMLWTGKYASARPVNNVDIEAAEDPERDGMFHRRPTPCWTKEEGDIGAKFEWSRDMSLGLFAYAYRKEQLELLQRHASYGEQNTFVMGEPLGVAVFYTPNIIGIMYQLIHALGGGDDPFRHWPGWYPSGLDDYQAHLQVMSIWLRCYVKTDEGSHGAITEKMKALLKEHVDREPNNPLFQYVYGLFTGNMGPAIDTLLDPERPVSGYVRCSVPETCKLAELIFVEDLVLERMGK